MLLLHYWECPIAVMGKTPMEQPSSHAMGLLIQTSLFIHTILLMSRVLKPFYNTAVSLFYSLTKIATYSNAVSLFYSLIKIATNIFQFSFTFVVYQSYTLQTKKPT